MDNKIDFVITWVDGSDEKWKTEKKRFQVLSLKEDKRDIRYRDWDNLRFFFRGIELFAPWVNRIHFVTWGHVPGWLDTDHPKLNIVSHSEFIPEEFLPTFNANPIEVNLHRISGLAEQFVYFNDDMLLLKKTTPDDFFRDGIPRDIGVMNVNISDRAVGNHIEAADMDIINDHFSKNDVIRRNWSKWYNLIYGRELIRNICLIPWKKFPGLLHQHIPTSLLKSTFEEVWTKEEEVLLETSRHRFRNSLDVNQWLFEDWQRCSGNFIPRRASVGRSFSITDNPEENRKVYKAIEQQKYMMICFNDMVFGDAFEDEKRKLIGALTSVMPEKSKFER